MRHLKNMGIVMLATGMIVAYGYLIETFMAWYSGDIFEKYMMMNRMFGPYGWMYWLLILFNILIPQALWFRRLHTNVFVLFVIAVSVNIGMWLERYVIVVASLHRDFMPSAWGMYSGTIVDYAVLAGSIGLFVCLLFIFIRVLPMISIFEMRELVHEEEAKKRVNRTMAGSDFLKDIVPIYGLMAEFDSPETLLEAARRAYATGFRRMDGYSPFPVEGLAEAIGFHRSRVPLIVLIGGILGCLGGFFLQYWASVIDYPINVGGRPLNSWPSFIPVTFEVTILLAALSAFFGVLALNGLPMPYHPVFNVERFELASRNRFFLCIEAKDANFDPQAVRDFFESVGAQGIYEVDP